MVNKAQLLLENLQSVYDRAVTASNDKTFFLSLYEYIEVFNNNSALEPIWKSIVGMGNIENQHINELAEKAYTEMRSTYQEITKYVEENKIERPGVLKSIKDFVAYESNSMHSSNGPIRAREGCLSYALMLLAQEKTPERLEFCRKYGTISDEGIIAEWHFSPSFNKWEIESKRLDRLRETKVWNSWNKLVYFYKMFNNHEEVRNEQIKENNFLGVMNTALLFDEIERVMGYKHDPDKKIHEYKQPDYLSHLQRVHQYTKEALVKVIDELAVEERKRTWTYDPASGVLYIGGKVVQFKKNNFRAKILELISKSDRNKKKTWEWDGIMEEIEGLTVLDGKHKHKVYDTIKALAEAIALKTGVTDFLIYDTNTLHINPSYLE